MRNGRAARKIQQLMDYDLHLFRSYILLSDIKLDNMEVQSEQGWNLSIPLEIQVFYIKNDMLVASLQLPASATTNVCLLSQIKDATFSQLVQLQFIQIDWISIRLSGHSDFFNSHCVTEVVNLETYRKWSGLHYCLWPWLKCLGHKFYDQHCKFYGTLRAVNFGTCIFLKHFHDVKVWSKDTQNTLSYLLGLSILQSARQNFWENLHVKHVPLKLHAWPLHDSLCKSSHGNDWEFNCMSKRLNIWKQAIDRGGKKLYKLYRIAG